MFVILLSLYSFWQNSSFIVHQVTKVHKKREMDESRLCCCVNFTALLLLSRNGLDDSSSFIGYEVNYGPLIRWRLYSGVHNLKVKFHVWESDIPMFFYCFRIKPDVLEVHRSASFPIPEQQFESCLSSISMHTSFDLVTPNLPDGRMKESDSWRMTDEDILMLGKERKTGLCRC